jgi:hypothetical protein
MAAASSRQAQVDMFDELIDRNLRLYEQHRRQTMSWLSQHMQGRL